MTSRSPTRTPTTRRPAEPRRAKAETPVIFLPIYQRGLPICPDGEVGAEIDLAIGALWGFRDGYAPPPTDDQVVLLLAYMRYCLQAPIRRGKDYAWLRESAARSRTLADLYSLYDAAAGAGIVF